MVVIPQQSSAHFQTTPPVTLPKTLTHPDSHLLFSPVSLSRSLFLPLTVLNLLVSCVHNKAKSRRKGSCRWAVRTSLKERRRGELLNYILYYTVLYFIFSPCYWWNHFKSIFLFFFLMTITTEGIRKLKLPSSMFHTLVIMNYLYFLQCCMLSHGPCLCSRYFLCLENLSTFFFFPLTPS